MVCPRDRESRCWNNAATSLLSHLLELTAVLETLRSIASKTEALPVGVDFTASMPYDSDIRRRTPPDMLIYRFTACACTGPA